MNNSAATSLLALLLLVGLSPSTQSFGQIPGFGLLQLESSARAAALGGSLVAISEDINAFLYNPALLGPSEHRSLSVSYMNHLTDVGAGFLAYGRDLGKLGVAAVGVRALNWGSIERTDATGAKNGSFSASDITMTFGLARARTDRLRYGVNIHYAHSSVDSYRASAILADVGAAYRIPEQQLTVSASASHFGIVLYSLGQETDAVPFDLRVGAAKKLRYLPLLVSITAYRLTDVGRYNSFEDFMRHTILGGEFQFTRALHIRFGYNHRRHEALKTSNRLDLAGIGLGFGLKITRFRLDYAFTSWSFAGLHQFTVQTRI